MKKLNTVGALHFIAPFLVVVVVAIAGSFFIVASHADSPTSQPVASAASKKCKSGYELVNARPSDFISGKYKSKAIRGKGLLCLKHPEGREVVNGPNNNTIIDYSKCPSSSVFAYDANNPDGTGYKLPWKVRSFNGGKAHELKTYYCIKKKDLFVARAANGVDVDNATSYMYSTRDFHNYKFYPAFAASEKCTGAKEKFSGCKQNYFFSYYGAGDVKR